MPLLKLFAVAVASDVYVPVIPAILCPTATFDPVTLKAFATLLKGILILLSIYPPAYSSLPGTYVYNLVIPSGAVHRAQVLPCGSDPQLFIVPVTNCPLL